jgi:hypothetical protein
MGLHADRLLRYHVRLAWSDDFFYGFPWTQPHCPPELTDFCTGLTAFHDHVKANGLLVTADDLPASAALPTISPDLLAADYLADFRVVWLRLLALLICDAATVADGVGVPTWEQPVTARRTALQITNAVDLSAATDAVPLLRTEADWQAFVQQFHRPDLTGVRVAVLGGQRHTFERAQQRLVGEYNVAECRRLPPASEENRTQQETRQRLSQIDLLVICTNRLAHSDTDQVANLQQVGALSCEIVRLNNDTADQIVRAVLDHFQRAEGNP